MADDFDRALDLHSADVDHQIVERRVDGINTIKGKGPVAALFVILLEDSARFLFGDGFTVHLETDPVLHVGDDPDLENMADAAEKEMTGKAMVDDVVALNLLEESLLNKCDVPFFAMRKPFKHRRCVVKCADKADFRDVELFGGLQENVA